MFNRLLEYRGSSVEELKTAFLPEKTNTEHLKVLERFVHRSPDLRIAATCMCVHVWMVYACCRIVYACYRIVYAWYRIVYAYYRIVYACYNIHTWQPPCTWRNSQTRQSRHACARGMCVYLPVCMHVHKHVHTYTMHAHACTHTYVHTYIRKYNI